MTTISLGQLLVDRLEVSHPARGMFDAAEFQFWPESVVADLHQRRLLSVASSASTAICDGCHWNCEMPVHMRRSSSDGALSAFIVCNEEPDLGVIPVEPRALQRFQTSLLAVARDCSVALGLTPPDFLGSSNSVALGRVRGRHGQRLVSLSLESGVLLIHVGEQEQLFVETLRRCEDDLKLDTDAVRRLANRKGDARRSAGRYRPDKSSQRAKAQRTQQRDRQLYQSAIAMRKDAAIPLVAIARKLTSDPRAVTPSGKPLSVGRIRKILTEQKAAAREKSRAKRIS